VFSGKQREGEERAEENGGFFFCVSFFYLFLIFFVVVCFMFLSFIYSFISQVSLIGRFLFNRPVNRSRSTSTVDKDSPT